MNGESNVYNHKSMNWDSIQAWMLSFGEAYGVNPIIFALLYFGTIPLSLFSFAQMARNIRRGKPLFWPIMGASVAFVGTYIYLFIVGKNIPIWVYFFVAVLIVYGAYQLWSRIQSLKNRTTEEKLNP